MTKNCKLSIWLFIPAVVICFAIRFAQIYFGTDMSQGFLYDDINIFLDYGFYAMLIVVLGVAVGLSFFDRKRGGAMHTNPVSTIVDARAAVLGFALLFMGLGALYEAYADFRSVFSGALMVVNAVGGVFFVALAFGVLYTKEIKPLQGFLLAGGGVYGAVRVICTFVGYMAVASVPEYLINCLSIVGETVFFMLAAKLLSGNEEKYTRVAITAVGVTTSVMILSEALARIACDIFGGTVLASRITMSQYDAELVYQLAQGNNGYMMQYLPWVDVFAGISMVVFLFAFSMKAKQVSEEPAEIVDNIAPSEDEAVSEEPDKTE